MGIYVFQLLWIFLCYPLTSISVKFGKRKISGRLVYLFFVFILLGLVMALRGTSVGTDTYVYYTIKVKIANAQSLLEANRVSTMTAPLYVAYVYILSIIFSSLQVITIIDALIIMVGMAVFINKSSKDVPFSCFLFLALTLYFESMNGTRQYIAIILVLNAIVLLKNDLKCKRGWMLMIVAIGVHNTAAISVIIIAGIFVSKKLKSANALCVFSVVFSVIISSGFFLFVNVFLRYFPYYSIYVNGNNAASIFFGTGGGRIIFLYIALLMVVIFSFDLLRLKVINHDSIEYAMLPATVFCVIVGIVFCKNVLIIRLLWYFNSLFISFIPNVYNNCKKSNRRFLYLLTIVGLMAYCTIHLVEDKSGIIPYMFFWDS